MFDPASADAALELRQVKLASVDERISSADTAERTASSFAAALSRHLEEWPPGALRAARAEADALHAAATLAQDRFADAESRHAALVEAAAEAEAAVIRAQEGKAESAQLVVVLENLENQTRQAADAARQAVRLRQEEVEAHTQAEAADLERLEAQRAAAEERQNANLAEQAALGLAQSLADLPDPGESAGPEVAPVDVPAAASMAELRSRFAEADRLLSAAVSESEVARCLARVDSELAVLGQRIGALEDDLAATATAFAVSPQAASEAVRVAAERDARAVRDQRATAHSEARSQLLLARKERQGLSEPDRAVDLGPLPESPEQLASLAEAAASAAEVARQERVSADEALRDARAVLAALRNDHEALSSRRKTLSVLLGQRDPSPADPFTGDASAAVDAAVTRLGDARAALEETTEAQSAAVRALTAFARAALERADR